MAKKGRPASYWLSLCDKLAAGRPQPSGKGWLPGTNNPFKSKLQNILACGVTKRKQSRSQLLFDGPAAECTCGWDHDKYDRENQPTPAAAAAEPPRPTKEVDFGILCKPAGVGVNDVRNKSGVNNIKKQKGFYDLEVFGPTNGKCPHCQSPNIEAGNVNPCVKTIFTLEGPRFVQGIGLKCKDCSGSQWQSFEKTYVDTLTKRQQNDLP